MGDDRSAQTGECLDASAAPCADTVALDRDVLKAAGEILERHRGQIPNKVAAERIARLFRAALIPRGKPGPPLSESVAVALEMRLNGKKWQDVYPVAIPGYRTMDKYERYARTTSLRLNVKKALKRREPKMVADSASRQTAT